MMNVKDILYECQRHRTQARKRKDRIGRNTQAWFVEKREENVLTLVIMRLQTFLDMERLGL